jgi:Cys-rich protein (TIGR01571 family)
MMKGDYPVDAGNATVVNGVQAQQGPENVVVVNATAVPVQPQYAVVAQPAPVIYNTRAVVPLNQTIENSQNSLLPYPRENRWHNSEFERCCACGGECCLAWCVPCVGMAHISSKLAALERPYCMKFWHIISVAMVLFVLDIIIEATVGGSSELLRIFIVVVTFQLRGLVRERLNIPGNCCVDCLCACFCTPCVITQMNGTLWRNPEKEPGCSVDDRMAYVV